VKLKIGKNSKISLFLLPVSIREEVNRGLSHLFEHLLIRKIPFLIDGYTNEDYALLKSFRILTLQGFLKEMREMTINADDLLTEKGTVIAEIREKQTLTNEMFFTKVWTNTGYSRSPLGEIDSVESITLMMVEEYRSQLLEQGILAIDYLNNLSQHGFESQNMESPHPIKRNSLIRFGFDGKKYISVVFSGDRDPLFLIEKLIHETFPRYSITHSEKRLASALVFEEELRSKFADHELFQKRLKKVRQRFLKDAAKLQKNSLNFRLNQMESLFFYRKTWMDRLMRIKDMSDEEIFAVMDLVHAYPS